MKYLKILVIAICLLFIVGCGSKSTPEESTPTPVAPAEKETAPATTETPTESTESASETEEEEGVVEVPETEMGPGLVSEEDLETGDYVQESGTSQPQFKDSGLAKDLTTTPERFSNFDCVMDEESGIRYITVKVTNTNTDKSLMISPKGVAKGYDTYFLVRGIVDTDPGCQTEELAPGESTVCLNIGSDSASYGNPAGLNKVNIQSPDNDGRKNTESVMVNCPE